MNASHTPGSRLDAAPDGSIAPDDESDQPPPARIVLEILDESGRFDDAGCASLERSLREVIVLAVADRDGTHDVRVAVVDDARMSELHLAHSGVEGTTDVLTFDLRDEPGGALDVDLALCVDEARRAAEGRPHDEVAELVLYGLHGVLHCLGFDDHDSESYRLMHAREDEILRDAGFGALFSGERS